MDMLWSPPYARALRLGEVFSIPMPALLGQRLYWCTFAFDSKNPADGLLCLAVNMEDPADVRELTLTPEGDPAEPVSLPAAPLPLTPDNGDAEYRTMLALLQRIAEGLLQGAAPNREVAQAFAVRFLALVPQREMALYQRYDADFLRLIGRVLTGGATRGEAQP